MQRCADPGIYRRSLEHWAIGGRVRVRGGGRGGLALCFQDMMGPERARENG